MLNGHQEVPQGLNIGRPNPNEVPKIDVILIDRKDLPSAGAGEASIIGVAPAIRNPILDATGKALNNLPMIPNGGL